MNVIIVPKWLTLYKYEAREKTSKIELNIKG